MKTGILYVRDKKLCTFQLTLLRKIAVVVYSYTMWFSSRYKIKTSNAMSATQNELVLDWNAVWFKMDLLENAVIIAKWPFISYILDIEHHILMQYNEL